MRHRVQHVHFVGIGGVGMCGLMIFMGAGDIGRLAQVFARGREGSAD